ncbi:MAG: calcium-binding protein [Acidimicrobiales bacterium]
MNVRRNFSVLAAAALVAVLLSSAQATAQQTHLCDGEVATIVGTPGDDVIRGTNGRDVIVGLAGSDRIIGGRGHDLICGGSGPDKLAGGAGRDRVIGGGGSDRISGGSAADTVIGGGGNDRLFGSGGDDTIIGGPGKDRIFGEIGNDTCTIDTDDLLNRTCELGNYRTWTGVGDDVLRPRLPRSFIAATDCPATGTLCSNYYVAKVAVDGPASFDALGLQAFNADGEHIIGYGDAGDRYEGVFLFHERPAAIEFDSGGSGSWSVTFVQASGVVAAPARLTSTGNRVYRLPRPLTGLVTTDATWDGFGNFAVIGVSPTDGRRLLVNEVRFNGTHTPPFTVDRVAIPGISLVQVLSDEGSWTVELGN